MKNIREQLSERFKSAVVESHDFRGDDTIVIKPEFLLGMCIYLKDELGFTMLMDLCAVDYPDRAERFEVVYHLYNIEKAKRLRLKVRLPEDAAHISSVCEVWRAANWYEREAYDLFGITFDGHRNLKRLLTFEGFEGHPLRKDYPKARRQAIPKPDPLVPLPRREG